MESNGYVDQFERLRKELSGQRIHIPSLTEQFSSWPMGTHPEHDRLRSVTDMAIESVVSDKNKQKKLKLCGFDTFTSLWYPTVRWEELRLSSYFLVWFFIWDDEIDLAESEIATDKDKTVQYCRMSIDYSRRVLGLADVLDTESTNEMDEPVHPCMELFREFAEGMARLADTEQRGRFFKELEGYINQVAVEQGRQHDRKFPNTEEYTDMRLGTVGATPCTACLDVIYGFKLPQWLVDSKEMQTIWKEVTMLCLLLNDLYSLKKELESNILQNLVVVMFNQSEDKNMDTVIATIIDMVVESKRSFDQAADALEGQTAHDKMLSDNTKSYIDACRYIVTGVVQWSLQTPRYKMPACTNKDGSIEFTVQNTAE